MKFQNFEKRDQRIIATALLLLLLSTTLLWQDAWIYQLVQSGNLNLEEIGEVKILENDVRRRHEEALSWIPIRNEAGVYQGDSIFTGDKSTVVIKTKTGEEISIAPNSLVVITQRSGSISIDIGFGSVQGKVGDGKKLLITSNDNITELSGSQGVIKVDAGEGNKLAVNVLSGQVNVNGKILSQNDAAEVGADGKPQDPNSPVIKLLEPLANQKFKVEDGEPVSFKWETQKNLQRMKIRIAKDSAMKDIVVSDPVEINSFPYQLPKDIPLYWQIASQSNFSSPSPFFIVGDRPPIPIYPKSGFQFYFDPFDPAAAQSVPVDLTWNEGSPSSSFEVELANDFEFKNVLQKLKSRSKEVTLGKLKDGQYFWRVRSIEFTNEKWSEISYFRVGPEPSRILTAPLPRVAEQRFLIETKETSLPTFELHRLTKMGSQKYIQSFPTLLWSPVQGADRYELQISRNKQFSDVILSQTIEKNYYTWKNIEPGTFFWRVRGLNENFKSSIYTNTQTIIIGIASPPATSQALIVNEVPDPVLLAAPPPPLRIAWRPSVFTNYYEVEFSSNKDFTNSFKSISEMSEKKFQVDKPGVYYWRVRSLDSQKTPISAFQQPQTVEFQRVYKDPSKIKNLMALNPRQEDSIVLVGKEKSALEFRWTNPFPGLDYRIEIAYEPNFENIVFSGVTKKNFLNYTEAFMGRVVYWRIRAESDKFTSDWTAANRFLVSYEDTPFDFEKSDLMFAARLRARERQAEIFAAQQRRLATLRSPASTVALQLDTPQLIDPTNKFLIESNFSPDLTTEKLNAQPYEKFYSQMRKFISFRWGKVPAAERYVIEIARDPEFKTTVVKAPAWDPFYEWDTARPGQFYYRIQAFNDRYTRSAFSKVEPLLVEVVTPTPTSTDTYVEVFDEPKDMWQPPSPFQLTWAPVIFARGYEIEFSEDKNFQLTKVFRTSGTSQELKVSKNGLFFWRVRPLNEFGVAIGHFSPTRSLEVIQTQRGPASVSTLTGLFPTDRTMIFVGKGFMNLTFLWTTPELNDARKLASGQNYTLEISKSENFETLVASKSATQPQATIRNDLPSGKLYWRVRSGTQVSGVQQFLLRREYDAYEGPSFVEMQQKASR